MACIDQGSGFGFRDEKHYDPRRQTRQASEDRVDRSDTRHRPPRSIATLTMQLLLE